jgi:hypothetical protein
LQERVAAFQNPLWLVPDSKDLAVDCEQSQILHLHPNQQPMQLLDCVQVGSIK